MNNGLLAIAELAASYYNYTIYSHPDHTLPIILISLVGEAISAHKIPASLVFKMHLSFAILVILSRAASLVRAIRAMEVD